jgi:putative membrane protein
MIVNTRAGAYLIALVLILATPVLLRAAQSTSLESLLNRANQMNNQEEDMASDLKSKAGDNQALITMAETIKEDHKANQSALESLASQKKISLNSYKRDKTAENELDNLKGAKFNEAFLRMDIRDHKKALASFRKAQTEFARDPDVRVYIDQTIPILEAHLKMAESLHHDDQALGSRENQGNNKD